MPRPPWLELASRWQPPPALGVPPQKQYVRQSSVYSESCPCVDPVRVSGREAVCVRQLSPRPCLNLNPSSRHARPPLRSPHRAPHPTPDTRHAGSPHPQSEIANAIRPNPLRYQRYQRYQRYHSPKIRAAVCTLFCVRHTAKAMYTANSQTAPAVDPVSPSDHYGPRPTHARRHALASLGPSCL